MFPEPTMRSYQDIFGERENENFLGGPVIKNLPAQKKKKKNLPATAGDTGSIPGPGTKTLCAMGQINPWATTTEPASRAVGCKYRSQCT